jgi:outer membrane protein insertion porin family
MPREGLPVKRTAEFFLRLAGLAVFATAVAGAELRVTGLGWPGNREAARSLELLLGEQRQGGLDAAAIEDAALILFHRLEEDGWLRPRITAVLDQTDGTRSEHPLTASLEPPLDRALTAHRAVFAVDRGPRFLLRDITFSGNPGLPAAEARTFFAGETALLQRAADRLYSPARMRQAAANLEEELRMRGHAEAQVSVAGATLHDAGAVDLAVSVEAGPLWRVHALRVETGGGPTPPPEVWQHRVGRRWSPLWRQDTVALLRRWYYERGYPDVKVRIASEAATPDPSSAERSITVTATVSPGPEARLGRVEFTGNDHTREASLRRFLDLQPGEPLDPVRLDRAQARLLRLGLFQRVDLRYHEAEPGVRDVEFALAEGRRHETSLLAGYGSYEQLRGGVEWRHHNLFGRAHGASLQLVQSMKSSAAEARYTVPDVLGSNASGSARLSALRREELAFVREESGVQLTLARPLPSWRATATASYGFQRLGVSDSELADRTAGRSTTTVASLELRFVRDLRDNPMRPRRGYRTFVQAEAASQLLGSRVDYQRLTTGASYHTAWGSGRWVHLALEHAVLTTFGADDDRDLPVNVRFFPGGDGSIRGYRRGAAAPLSPTGGFIGAKSTLFASAEIEQALTRRFSVTAFIDGLGTAARLADYPFEDRLFSAGAGLRYYTIVGPIRLEYGHNLNRREFDPKGTWLLSVGLPF